MKIAHISDLHIAAEGQTLGVAPMAENLARVVAHINGLQPDLVLVSGDIANAAREDETRRAARLLAGLEAPFYLTPGNHDTREALWQAFGGTAIPAREATHLSYVVETPDMRLIALDSTDPDAPNGRICADRAAWLEEKLAGSTRPTLVMLHHPPLRCAVEETDSPPLEGAALLAAVVARHPQIERIVCGHIHLMVQALWHGRLVCSAPSIGMRLHWSPLKLVPSHFTTAPPAYLWHMHNAAGEFITHEVTLNEKSRPYSF